jgi:hypothetical protein
LIARSKDFGEIAVLRKDNRLKNITDGRRSPSHSRSKQYQRPQNEVHARKAGAETGQAGPWAGDSSDLRISA